MRQEPQFLYLTTTGRQSGLPREIEIWFTRRNGRYYMVAETRERAQWVQNLMVDPRVRVRVADQAFVARARVVTARAERGFIRAVQRGSRAKYGWGEGLVVELVPQTRGRGK